MSAAASPATNAAGTATVRTLVVDDSSLFRHVMREALRPLPGVSVVGNAAGGREAIEKARELRPDLICLDLEMPGGGGLEVLPDLRRELPEAMVLVVSRHATAGSQAAAESLLEGAFDFLPKPEAASRDEALAELRTGLARKLEVVRLCRQAMGAGRSAPAAGSGSAIAKTTGDVGLVAIAASTGGPAVLKTILSRLPASLPVPVIVVQHMTDTFLSSMCERLDGLCSLPVRLATAGPLVPGEVVVAPGGRHLQVFADGGDSGYAVGFSDEPPRHGCRPAADVTLETAAVAAAVRDQVAAAAVLTGMGRDGTAGSLAISAAGGTVIAQDEQTSAVFGMPRSVISAGAAAMTLPPEAIPLALGRLVAG